MPNFVENVMTLPSFSSATSIEGPSAESIALLREHCSGGCNVLHILAALSRPLDPIPVSGDKKSLSGSARSTPRGLLRDIMKQAMAMARTPPSALAPMGENI